MNGRAATLVIDGEFTTLNNYISAERSNKFLASKIKKSESMRAQVAAFAYPARLDAAKRYDVICTWFRKDTRTDPDNIAFAIKFILDGLQTSGFLPSDRWEHIASICHTFEIDRSEPRVEIAFEEVCDDEKVSDF